jgi:hypothetical protein
MENRKYGRPLKLIRDGFAAKMIGLTKEFYNDLNRLPSLLRAFQEAR